MSTHLKPAVSMRVRVPKKRGKATIKIDLFRVGDFEVNCASVDRTEFFPRVPLCFEDRQLYWMSAQYRLRINGKWFCPKGRYTFFRLHKVAELIDEAMQ